MRCNVSNVSTPYWWFKSKIYDQKLTNETAIKDLFLFMSLNASNMEQYDLIIRRTLPVHAGTYTCIGGTATNQTDTKELNKIELIVLGEDNKYCFITN